MGDGPSRKLTELRRFLTFQDVSIICLIGHVDALSRLKHGFNSRRGHHRQALSSFNAAFFLKRHDFAASIRPILY